MRRYPHLRISARGPGPSGTSTHLTRQLSGTRRVGGGRACALPPPARSNGSCSFPASRFPVWAPLRRRRRSVLQCQSTPPGYPRCRRRVFRKANLSALPSCTYPFLVVRLCHTVRGLPPPHGLLGPSGVVIPR